MKPEVGPQPQDGSVDKEARGRARLHEHGDTVEAEDVIVKFKRIWSQGYAGNSGVERLFGK